LGEVITPHHKKYHITNHSERHWTWTDPLLQIKQRKKDMRFGTWNVRKLYRSGSLTTPARELARYKLNLVGYRKLVGTKRAQ
jgi:hypothetical protein